MNTDGGAGKLTIALCTAACNAGGYLYAGTEYGGECCELFHLLFNHHALLKTFHLVIPSRLIILDCGNSIVNKGAPATDPTTCNMVCN